MTPFPSSIGQQPLDIVTQTTQIWIDIYPDLNPFLLLRVSTLHKKNHSFGDKEIFISFRPKAAMHFANAVHVKPFDVPKIMSLISRSKVYINTESTTKMPSPTFMLKLSLKAVTQGFPK